MASRRSALATLPVVLLVPALALAPVLAWGGGAKKKTDASASAPSREYSTTCAQGNSRYVARDFDGAIALYRKAIERAPHQALGYYLLGEAQLAAGNLPEAEASWTRAATEAGEKDPALEARILFVTADLKERQKKWEDAKAAWQVYLDWANRFPDVGVFPASAQSREAVLDTVIKQDKTSEIVRQRIAASQDGGVFSDSTKSPPATK
jgi:tetratricopeptide (TPR) repeat protein